METTPTIWLRTLASGARRALRAFPMTTLALAACSDLPTPPVRLEPGPPPVERDARKGRVLLTVLHDASGQQDASSGWGTLAVYLGLPAAATPCGTERMEGAPAVCGVIHNPGNELFTTGRVQVVSGAGNTPLALEFTFPPTPCATYLLRGAFAGDPAQDPPGIDDEVLVAFTSDRGVLEGTARHASSGDTGPGVSGTAASPGPPTEPVCVVTSSGR